MISGRECFVPLRASCMSHDASSRAIARCEPVSQADSTVTILGWSGILGREPERVVVHMKRDGRPAWDVSILTLYACRSPSVPWDYWHRMAAPWHASLLVRHTVTWRILPLLHAENLTSGGPSSLSGETSFLHAALGTAARRAGSANASSCAVYIVTHENQYVWLSGHIYRDACKWTEWIKPILSLYGYGTAFSAIDSG